MHCRSTRCTTAGTCSDGRHMRVRRRTLERRAATASPHYRWVLQLRQGGPQCRCHLSPCAAYWTAAIRNAHESQGQERKYNCALQLASSGIQVDCRFYSGVAALSIHNGYHSLGDLHPQPGEQPRFAQLFIHDSVAPRMDAYGSEAGLDAALLAEMQHMLRHNNVWVRPLARGHKRTCICKSAPLART